MKGTRPACVVGTMLLTMATMTAVGPSASADDAASKARFCHGKRATIVGTNRADGLTGTPGRDVIFAGACADIIEGRAGNDLICGARGGDVLW